MAQWWLVRDVARTTMGTSREGGVAAQTVRLRLETEQMVRVRSVGKECARARVFLRKKKKNKKRNTRARVL